MVAIAWYGLILYIITALLYFIGILIFDEGSKRIEALIKFIAASPLLYFFIKYLF